MRFCFCDQPVFGTDKKTLIGYCKAHQHLRTDTDKRSIIQRAMDKNKKSKALIRDRGSIRKLASEDNNQEMIGDKVQQAEMQLFWLTAEKELELKPFCQECGATIPKKIIRGSTSGGYRAATAHIFPKSLFPSVAANINNRLFLGATCGCHNKTVRLDQFVEMKVWPLAVEKFKLFEHLITEKHKYLDIFKRLAEGTY